MKIKLLKGFISSETPLLSLDGHLLPVSSSCFLSVPVCDYTSSSSKDITPIGFRPTLKTSFYLNYPFKDSIFKYSRIFEVLGVGLQHMHLLGAQFSP